MGGGLAGLCCTVGTKEGRESARWEGKRIEVSPEVIHQTICRDTLVMQATRNEHSTETCM